MVKIVICSNPSNANVLRSCQQTREGILLVSSRHPIYQFHLSQLKLSDGTTPCSTCAISDIFNLQIWSDSDIQYFKNPWYIGFSNMPSLKQTSTQVTAGRTDIPFLRNDTYTCTVLLVVYLLLRTQTFFFVQTKSTSSSYICQLCIFRNSCN